MSVSSSSSVSSATSLPLGIFTSIKNKGLDDLLPLFLEFLPTIDFLHFTQTSSEVFKLIKQNPKTSARLQDLSKWSLHCAGQASSTEGWGKCVARLSKLGIFTTELPPLKEGKLTPEGKDILDFWNLRLQYEASHGRLEIVNSIPENLRGQLNWTRALKEAQENNQAAIVQYIQTNHLNTIQGEPSLQQSVHANTFFELALKVGPKEVIVHLLKTGRYDQQTYRDIAICLAKILELPDVLQKLLNGARFNPRLFKEVMTDACCQGYTWVVSLLLADKGVDCNQALPLAAAHGHVDLVRRLLADKRINPAAEDNFAVRLAAASDVEHGRHADVVSLLLADKRINPAAENNYAVRLAAAYGRVDVVKLLLADSRVNPAAENNYAVRLAAAHGDVDVVKLLLAHPRVNPEEALNACISDGSPQATKMLHELSCNPALGVTQLFEKAKKEKKAKKKIFLPSTWDSQRLTPVRESMMARIWQKWTHFMSSIFSFLRNLVLKVLSKAS